MANDNTALEEFMNRPRRFLPPIAGGAQTTGWEALDKWVGGSSGGASAPAPSGKTGWEALDKWVGGSGGGGASAPAAAAPSGKTGWEALDKWVGGGAAAPSAEASAGNGAAAPAEAPAAAPEAAASGGGFVGFLKRLFGGK